MRVHNALFAILILSCVTPLVSASDERVLNASEALEAGRQADRSKSSDVNLHLVYIVGATRLEEKGQFKDWLILNSSATFGSCHSLQIGIPPQVLKVMMAGGISDAAAHLNGKRLRIRAQVACVDEPRENGKGTYRQVRLNLLSSDDLTVLTGK